jgi:hypothetical protein
MSRNKKKMYFSFEVSMSVIAKSPVFCDEKVLYFGESPMLCRNIPFPSSRSEGKPIKKEVA